MSVENLTARLAQSNQFKEDLGRPVLLHICKDGTISYRRHHEKVFNGRALPVFSVNDEDMARSFQIRFGRLMPVEHPLLPGKPWYKLSSIDGEDVQIGARQGTLELEDLDRVRDMFRQFYLQIGRPLKC